MLNIRLININDDFNRYMECVEELNGQGMDLCNIEQMRSMLINRTKNIMTYVLTLDNLIVSTATIIFENKLRYQKPCCHIEDVGVHPDFRKKGYGKMIVDHCIMVAKSEGCYKIKLCCSDKNVVFYNKSDFKISSNGMEQSI